MFDDYRAATDIVPRTQEVEPYVLRREGLPQAIVLDTAGYDVADPRHVLGSLIDRLHGCDMVVCVCSAASAAREADRRFLSELRAEFQRNPDRHMPVIVAALTHIDRLRPLREWSPPYRLDPPSGPKARQIAEAVEAVAADLALTPAEVIPVCLSPERIYNVEEALVPAMLDRLPAAQRVQYVALPAAAPRRAILAPALATNARRRSGAARLDAQVNLRGAASLASSPLLRRFQLDDSRIDVLGADRLVAMDRNHVPAGPQGLGRRGCDRHFLVARYVVLDLGGLHAVDENLGVLVVVQRQVQLAAGHRSEVDRAADPNVGGRPFRVACGRSRSSGCRSRQAPSSMRNRQSRH